MKPHFISLEGSEACGKSTQIERLKARMEKLGERVLVTQRAAVRAAKDWAQSDALRKQIEALGWKLKDTPKGQEVSKA